MIDGDRTFTIIGWASIKNIMPPGIDLRLFYSCEELADHFNSIKSLIEYLRVYEAFLPQKCHTLTINFKLSITNRRRLGVTVQVKSQPSKNTCGV